MMLKPAALSLRTARPLSLPLIGLGFALAAVLLTALALYNPLYAVALLYVVGFLTLAWRKPEIALMLIFASMPFQSDMSGGGTAKFSIAELNLALTVPIFYLQCVARKQRVHVGPILLPVVLYFAVCAYSSFLIWRGTPAALSLFQMFLYFIIAVMVFCGMTPTPEKLLLSFYGLLCTTTFLSVAAMATHYTFLHLNKNGIGDSLAVGVLVAAELWFAGMAGPQTRTSRRRNSLLLVIMAIILIGLLFSLSRGAWLGTLLGLGFIMAMRREFRLLLRVALVLIPLVAVFWALLPQDSKSYATGFGKSNYNINARYQSVDLAETYYNKSPLYGRGVGLRKDYDATNIVFMLLAETGILGVLTFFFIHVVYFRMIWTTQRRVMRSEVMYSLLAVGGALILDKLAHGMVDHYWSRGALMAAWASAGMATRVYYVTRERVPAARRLA